MSEMSDFKTTYGENGEKWRWRICLFHLSNSLLAPLPLPLSLWYNLKLEKYSQPSSLDISKNVHFYGAQYLPHYKRGYDLYLDPEALLQSFLQQLNRTSWMGEVLPFALKLF